MIWEIIFSNGTSSKRGVAILIKNSSKLNPTKTIKDDDGRFIITQIPILNKNIVLVNLYGPNEDLPSFFQKIFDILENLENTQLILGGDWNVVQNFEIDRFGCKNDYKKKSRQLIHSWMEENSMSDIWRLKNPSLKRYTLI